MSDKVNKIIPMKPHVWTATKLIAETNERSASAQIRHWINEGIRMNSEQDRWVLDEIDDNYFSHEANA